MAKLKASRRRKIPASKFAYPKQRKYPLDTKARARSALKLAAKKNTFGTATHVRRKVRTRYPSLVKKKR